MSLSGIAKETLDIIEAGSYISPSGQKVLLAEQIERALHLNSPRFSYAFERVVFAIYDRSSSQRVISPFRERFTREH